MGHCTCRDGFLCAWCRPRIERAEGNREHRDTRPYDEWDADAEAAETAARGAA